MIHSAIRRRSTATSSTTGPIDVELAEQHLPSVTVFLDEPEELLDPVPEPGARDSHPRGGRRDQALEQLPLPVRCT